MKKRIEVIMAVVLLVGAYFFAREGAHMVENMRAQKGEICIVVDAGHGGDDPGKIGVNKEKEKDINLKIARKLQKLLEKEGVKVVMTRIGEGGLYQQSSNNKKVEDMRKRCEIITEAKPVFTVSIHQNSYPEESVKGAQVFYYGQSQEGKKLAEALQKAMVAQLDPQNHRQAKANESYFLLKKTPSPTVIVECGFLSNSQEAALLATEEYQDKVAEAVKDGILEYLGRDSAGAADSSEKQGENQSDLSGKQEESQTESSKKQAGD
ncbi:MAG: N-acetylmuramoyl-L-alanine amidase [Lachnospiraceae bacterium]|nr:N-acetylmuramoyl-L-alanine amidase [Lachnospiraceae bacterium]